MSKTQADARESIVSELRAAGWDGTAYGDNYDYENGLYAYHEASLEYYSTERVHWRLHSDATENAIHLTINIPPNVEIALIVREADSVTAGSCACSYSSKIGSTKATTKPSSDAWSTRAPRCTPRTHRRVTWFA